MDSSVNGRASGEARSVGTEAADYYAKFQSLGALDEYKRQNLKKYLSTCFEAVNKMQIRDPDLRIDQLIKIIDVHSISKQEDEEELTLNECLAEINVPDADSDCGLTDEAISALLTEETKPRRKFRRSKKSNVKCDKRLVQSSEESPVVNNLPISLVVESKPSIKNQSEDFEISESEVEIEVPPEPNPFGTPEKIRNKLSVLQTVSSKKQRRSRKTVPQSHKITRYFPGKTKNSTPNTEKKIPNHNSIDFILSAMDGDSTFCVLCEKKFNNRYYLITHYADRHGIDKDSLNRNRSGKKGDFQGKKINFEKLSA